LKTLGGLLKLGFLYVDERGLEGFLYVAGRGLEGILCEAGGALEGLFNGIL